MRTLALAALLALALAPAVAQAQAYVNGQQAVATPTSTANGITVTAVTLNANTSTQLAPANPNRIALGIQCGTGGVSISETGQTLAGASVGNGSLFLPSGTAGPYFSPPVATTTAITAYTATSQTCVTTEYQRQ
jgi:hypothetical protein